MAKLKIFVNGDDGFQIVSAKENAPLIFQFGQSYGIAVTRPKFLGSVIEIGLIDFGDKKDKIQVALLLRRSG